MIKANFKRDSRGNLKSFIITGHANSGEYGKDIVCAGVSAVTIGAVNGIAALAGFEPEVESNQEDGGYLSLSLENQDIPGEKFDIAQILLENLLLSLTDMSTNYDEYLTVNTITE